VFSQKDNLTFVYEMDTKNVVTLSNLNDPRARGTVMRRTGARVQDNMKGVDLMDQMTTPLPTGQTSGGGDCSSTFERPPACPNLAICKDLWKAWPWN